MSRATRVIGIASASIGLAASGLVVASAPVSAATPPQPLDHFLCYVANANGFKVPKGVMLANVLQTAFFAPTIQYVATHCNPADKQVISKAGQTTTYLAKNPKAHLLCWKIAYPNFSQTHVVLQNQFGQAAMLALPPTKLCLPTWKKLTGPPKQKLVQPPGLDHFTCYPLKVLAGAYRFTPPPVVRVRDQFSAPKYVQVKLGVADLLCVPTVKKVGSVIYPPQSANDQSLVCFPEFTTPIKPKVFDQNQFGTSTVYLTKHLEELCLPTTMKKL